VKGGITFKSKRPLSFWNHAAGDRSSLGRWTVFTRRECQPRCGVRFALQFTDALALGGRW